MTFFDRIATRYDRTFAPDRASTADDLAKLLEGRRGTVLDLGCGTGRAFPHLLSMGFDVIGRIPAAFAHPSLGDVDALIMHRAL